MQPQFSLAQLTVLKTSPAEISRIAADCGYDYVSMRQIYMGLPEEPDYDLSKNKKLMAETKAVFADTGIKLLDIELARIFDGMDVKKYEPAMTTAVELGGKHVLSSIWTLDREYAIERFAELCDLAAQYGLTVELEYVPIAGVRTLGGAVDVLRKVNRKNAGLMIDIHHFHRAQDDPAELAKLPEEWFRFAHLCDAPAEIPSEQTEMVRILREARSYVGEGGIDIAPILNAMPVVPYSIELPNLERVAESGYAEHARRCLESAKAFCAGHLKGRSE
ncbi:MAG TPA: sugar phosphate isomerase/epimerase [Synergistales bacterium]|nr:sugar phosphate isomerase/epimerase [Synergistales bacterium]